MSGERPWIGGELSIPASVLKELEAHALETYPNECCGFVSGPASEPLALDASVREANEADKYHKLDPVTFPRTARTYFKINELRAAKAFEAGEKSGQPIKVIYHSHCDAGAYFSAEDAATFAADNQLMWPCAFIVVSVEHGEPVGQRVWVHRPGTNEFDEGVLEIVD